MLKKILKIFGVILLVLFLGFTLAFTSHEYNKISCNEINVDYESDDVFTIDKKKIRNAIIKADDKVIGKALNEIDGTKLETEIEKNPAVLNAEVYKFVTKENGSYKGILAVDVKHREPVLRVINANNSYYLDENGQKFVSANSCPAHVLIATGNIKEDFAKKELLPFVLYINENDFWKAQIEQIQVNKNTDVILTPLVGTHLIEFGSLDNYEKKLRNMKVFYKEVLAKDNWNKYKNISLKYKNQVIAKRR